MNLIFKICKWLHYRLIGIKRNYYNYLVRSECGGGCGDSLFVVSRSVVTKKTTIGSHVAMNDFSIIGEGECVIGSYCHFGEGTRIITSSHNYKGMGIPYDTTSIIKPVFISDFVWFGVGVTVLPGSVIGEGVIAQAGSVIRGEIPPYSIVGGNPATVFAMRDVEHFKQCKEKNLFF